MTIRAPETKCDIESLRKDRKEKEQHSAEA